MNSLTLDLEYLDKEVFERVEANADLLAELGTADADSVIHALDLPSEQGEAQVALPPRPFLAFREMPIFQGGDRDVRIPTYRWHIYDDREYGYARIKRIIPLIGKAYDAEPQIQFVSGGIVGSVVVTGASSSTRDPSLNLLMRYVDVSVTAAS